MPNTKPTELMTICIDPALRHRLERYRTRAMRRNGYVLSRSGVVRTLLLRALDASESRQSEDAMAAAESTA